jgi:hypothetical protein
MITWAKFEHFALDGPDNKLLDCLFWPQFIAQMLYLIFSPLRSKVHNILWNLEKRK